jgi:glycosyltransferase involved in cell wall biosynthesis
MVMVLAEGSSRSMEDGILWRKLEFEGTSLSAALREEVLRFAPDVVYENGVRSRSQRAALEILVLTGARLAMQSEDDDVQVYETHHGSHAAEILTLVDKPRLSLAEAADYLRRIDLRHSIASFLDPSYDRWVEPVTRALCYRLASLHTAIWEPFRQRLEQEYGVPTLVVPPVAADAEFDRLMPNEDERAHILRQHGIPARCVVIFIGGALYSYSAEYALFLSALNYALAEQDQPIALVVPPGRATLPVARMARERLKPQIHFAAPDLSSDGDYIAMLKACDVVCSPGLPDTFNRYRLPSRLVKAMAMAKPVLTCRCGFGESLQHGVNAFLMDGTDPKTWASAILPLLDAETRIRVGQQGRLFAEKHFRGEEVAKRLKTAFLEIMSGPTRHLADGFDEPIRSESRNLFSEFLGDLSLKLKARCHHSTRDAVRLLAHSPITADTVVHIGAGRGGEFEEYCRMGVGRIHLVDASERVTRELSTLRDLQGKITVTKACVARETGESQAWIFNNLRADTEEAEDLSLLRPDSLLEWKPSLEIVREETVSVMSMEQACAEVDVESGETLLVLSVNGMELAILQSISPEFLRKFRWILTRVSETPLYEGGATRGEVERHLSGSGFTAETSPPNFVGRLTSLLFTRR